MSDLRAAVVCGARAVGGACILPSGHNMGNVDIPASHKASAETRWAFLDTETGEWIEVVPGTVALANAHQCYDVEALTGAFNAAVLSGELDDVGVGAVRSVRAAIIARLQK